jgi:tRNA pseudouridine32 synthase/23S rRNA pseudouridine746 synthase
MSVDIQSSGIQPSALHLPRGTWSTVLDCLCEHFPAINRAQWLDRMARGRVYDAQGIYIDATSPYCEGARIYYFREVAEEAPIPVLESILHIDEHLIVVDKPHFLPVTPAGSYVEQTLLARLIRRYANPQLVPLHRIDRMTAGLVLFSANRSSRAAYQALFRDRKISKSYEAIAPPLPQLDFPLLYRSRLQPGEPFFRMRESSGGTNGEVNSETLIEVIERGEKFWRYALYPHTGKKHQLRVHMAALGAPICNDPLYPQLQERSADDYARPLQLLAKSLTFTDPLNGELRSFSSRLRLTE